MKRCFLNLNLRQEHRQYRYYIVSIRIVKRRIIEISNIILICKTVFKNVPLKSGKKKKKCVKFKKLPSIKGKRED